MAITPFKMQCYFGWLAGLTAMMHLHNLIVSLLLYKFRETKVSNILKVLFNLGGLLRNIGQLWFLVIPIYVTTTECELASYFLPVANVIYKSALVAFLLWRLRQIEIKKTDIWIGLILFTIRLLFHLATPIVGIGSYVNYDTENLPFRCTSDVYDSRTPLFGTVVIELMIYFFVTFRLVKALMKANEYSDLMKNTVFAEKNLFKTVMCWNFIRVFLAIASDVVTLSYTILGFYSDYNLYHAFIENNIQAILYISLSYSITADIEIMRVTEDKKFLPNSLDSSTKRTISETSRSKRTSNQSLGSVQFTTDNYELSEADEKSSNSVIQDKVTFVSMKKLTFTECANLVLDGSANEKNGDDNYEGKKIEIEVINEEEAADNNLSGTTSMTSRTTKTLNDDPDIV